jgi:hypothetical protein
MRVFLGLDINQVIEHYVSQPLSLLLPYFASLFYPINHCEKLLTSISGCLGTRIDYLNAHLRRLILFFTIFYRF